MLRHGSNITTNATGTATGGNITIATSVLAALENSDISTNALAASGGRVTINTQGIFGTEFRNQATPNSDITATSNLGLEFSGSVQINSPEVDLTRGLVALPATVVDVTELVAQSCPGGGSSVASSEFSVIGRGGLPPNPSDPPSSEAVLADWATLQEPGGESRSGAEATVNTSTKENAATQIVEAQGWEIGPKGEVVLTPQAHTITPHSPGFTPISRH